MKTELYIANKLTNGLNNKKTVSKTVFKIAIIATVISIVVMLIAVATGIGLQKQIKQNLSALYGHFSLQNFDSNLSDVNIIPITFNDTIQKILNDNPLQNYYKTAYKAGIIRTEKTFEGFLLKGLTADYNAKTFQDFIIQGQFPSINPQDSVASNQVLISKTLAQKLELTVGDNFKAFFVKEKQPDKSPNQRTFVVSGIYASGVKEFDDNHVIGDLAHIQRMNKWQPNQVGAIECFATSINQAEALANNLYHQLPTKIDVITLQKKNYHIFEWLKIFDFNILTILIIMMIVSLVNIIVSLLVLILENVSLIGVLKTLGYDNTKIQKIFIFQTIKIILKGLLIGNVIVLIIIFLQNKFHIIKLNPENYYVTIAPFYFNVNWVLAINVVFLVVIFISLQLPALLITRLKPAELIKFNY